MIPIRPIALTLLLLLGGCAASSVSSPAERALQQWVGQPLTAVVAGWGSPGADILVQGERQLIYPASQFTSASRPANLPQGQEALTRPDYPCRAILVVDNNERIRAAQWVGEECR